MTDTGAHGAIRRDAPGGWKGDLKNGFSEEGLSAEQLDMFNYIRNLSRIRSDYAELFSKGKRTQYIPEKGLYAFFMEGDKEILGVFVNQSDMPISVNSSKYPDIPAIWANGTVMLNPETKGLQVPPVSPMAISVVRYPRQGK
jgi:glycosidase